MKRVGRRIEYIESVASTNDEAWRHIDDHDADGLVVLAEYQSAGRGRFGRTWRSPRGASLLCSVALIEGGSERRVGEGSEQSVDRSIPHPSPAAKNGAPVRAKDGAPAQLGGQLVLTTAVAVCHAIKAATDVTPTIKWPNDLTVSGRKLAGILIESRTRIDGAQAYVIGTGINCLQHKGHLEAVLNAQPTSLELESAHPIDRTALAVSLLSELDLWLTKPREWLDEHLHDEWLARAEPMGQRVCLQHGGRSFSGSVIDVDPGAGLVVRLDDGTVRAFNAATTTLAHSPPSAP